MEPFPTSAGSKSQFSEFRAAVEIIQINTDKTKFAPKLFSGVQHFRKMPWLLDFPLL
jgi:hypothetical protein